MPKRRQLLLISQHILSDKQENHEPQTAREIYPAFFLDKIDIHRIQELARAAASAAKRSQHTGAGRKVLVSKEASFLSLSRFAADKVPVLQIATLCSKINFI